jgi:hypothetical protein
MEVFEIKNIVIFRADSHLREEVLRPEKLIQNKAF